MSVFRAFSLSTNPVNGNPGFGVYLLKIASTGFVRTVIKLYTILFNRLKPDFLYHFFSVLHFHKDISAEFTGIGL